MIKPEEYTLLEGFQQFGSGGKLGIKIMIAGDRLPDDEHNDKLRSIAYQALEQLKDEVIHQRILADPVEMEIAANERRMLLECFETESVFVSTLPNGYCPRGCCKHRPWFRVTTSVGHFTIGWRKRVINIDWSDTVGTGNGEDLFKGEDTTVGTKYVHAWGYEKAKEYVEKIIESAQQPASCPS